MIYQVIYRHGVYYKGDLKYFKGSGRTIKLFTWEYDYV